MTTYQELVDETRDHLMTGQPDKVNVLDLDIDALTSSTLVQLRYALEGIDIGSRLSIGPEIMHVISKSGNIPLSQATVIRAYMGSAPVAHTAGSLVRVNAQFSDWNIMKQINKCLLGLSGHGLYQIKPFEFTYVPAIAGYPITAADMIDVWRVSYTYPGPEKDWPILRKTDWTLNQHANTTDFPTGKQLVLHQGGYPGSLVRVSYKARFGTLVNLSDDVETITGLPLTAHEIVPMGAAMRLLYGREIKRSFLNRQPEPRRQSEVPPGAALRSMSALVQAYYDTIDREVRVLHRHYPEQV